MRQVPCCTSFTCQVNTMRRTRRHGVCLFKRRMQGYEHVKRPMTICAWRKHARANSAFCLSCQALACYVLWGAWCRLPHMHQLFVFLFGVCQGLACVCACSLVQASGTRLRELCLGQAHSCVSHFACQALACFAVKGASCRLPRTYSNLCSSRLPGAGLRLCM